MSGLTKTLIGGYATIFVIIGVLAYFNDVRQKDHKAIKATNNKAVTAHVLREIVYFKDERTGLCFAYYASGHAATLTLVPEDKVKQYLIEQ